MQTITTVSTFSTRGISNALTVMRQELAAIKRRRPGMAERCAAIQKDMDLYQRAYSIAQTREFAS